MVLSSNNYCKLYTYRERFLLTNLFMERTGGLLNGWNNLERHNLLETSSHAHALPNTFLYVSLSVFLPYLFLYLKFYSPPLLHVFDHFFKSLG